MKLRDYQEELISKVHQSFTRGNRRVMMQSPAGSGKTVTMSEIVRRANLKGNSVLVIVHRRELVQQIKDTFKIRGATADVCMVQTAVRRLDKYNPSIIMIDEAHHSTAKTYRNVIEHYENAHVIGLTATPYRLGKQGFTDLYDDLVLGKSVQWLIDNDRLAPYVYKSVDLINHEELKKSRGDYTKDSIDNSFSRKIFGDVVKQYKSHADGLKTIIYCHSVESSRQTAERFKLEGYRAYHLDGKSSTQERLEAVSKFRSGEIEILTNAELFGEGFDIPDCYCVILLRPTQSLSLFIQQSMRAMRYVPGKTATILDLVGNWEQHGLPEMDIDWAGYFKGQQKKQNSIQAKECKFCYSVIPSNSRECPNCGEEILTGVTQAKAPIIIDKELHEITKDNVIKLSLKQPEDCKNMRELYALAKEKEYKPGWAYHQGKRLGLI